MLHAEQQIIGKLLFCYENETKYVNMFLFCNKRRQKALN